MTIAPATTDVALRPRNVALVAARAVGGLGAALQLAGAAFFLLVASQDAVWLGPWVDVPVLAGLFTAVLLKLFMALAPGLSPGRRIRVGLLAVGLGVVPSAMKVALYDGPESLPFLAVDAVVLALLVLASRTDQVHRRLPQGATDQ